MRSLSSRCNAYLGRSQWGCESGCGTKRTNSVASYTILDRVVAPGSRTIPHSGQCRGYSHLSHLLKAHARITYTTIKEV
ncbi:hypothetical protein JB92DRAFT_2942204 [Gautieria morchelliformis]|nr:hypothetical protein JB92DRAFT_2942204 [Gautieria morchelliformis]